MAEAPGHQTLNFSVLVRKASETAVSSLNELCKTGPDLSDTEKKIALLKCVLRTRQRLLRLLALSKWCRQYVIGQVLRGVCEKSYKKGWVDQCANGNAKNQIPLVERCQQLTGTLSNHDMSFTQAADFLFYLHDTLQQARAPVYDIPTASEILVTGSYRRLPTCIENLGMPPLLTGNEKEAALLKLDTLLRSRLLDVLLPRQISDMTVTSGRVILRVTGEFEAHLTLGYRGNLCLWRVLKLDILVGESSGPVQFTDPQRYFLGDELERRMAASDDPLGLLYSILHQFCTALVMDTLFRQVKVLQGGRWRDAIKFEKISETSSATVASIGQGVAGQTSASSGDVDAESGRTSNVRGAPGLKIFYWLESPKGDVSPSLRIEHGADQQIMYSHFPAVVDPSTEAEAEFRIDSSCINVEKLLLKAITCNVHSRLLEVQRSLKGDIQLWQSDHDVVLRHSMPAELESSSKVRCDDGKDEEAGEEVLCVRAFGPSYIALGISIRNGRFLLRCPRALLAAPVLKDMDDALNLATIQPLDILVNLRMKCLLHYFGLIGRSLNLKLHERGTTTLTLPLDGPKLGADVLIMGFPQCGDSFFICLQLDSNFTPFFTLLEAHPQSSPGQTTLMSSSFNIFRWMNVDIETMYLSREDASFSLLDESGFDDMESSVRISSKSLELEGIGKSDTFAPTRGPNRADSGVAIGLEIMETCSEEYYAGDRGGVKSFGVLSQRGSMLVAHPPSNLQAGGSPLPHGSLGYGMPGGSYVSNDLLTTTTYHQGGPPGCHQEGNSRMGWRGSPLRSPVGLRNQITHYMSPARLRSPLQGIGDQELLNRKSPLGMGDNAASPIDLDDEDLSKLIDSISSKTPPSGLSGSFLVSDPSTSLQMRPVLSTGMSRSVMGLSPGKGTSLPASQLGQSSGSSTANSSGWKSIISSSVSLNADTSTLTQQWTGVEHKERAGMRTMQGVSRTSSNIPPGRKRSILDLFNTLPSVQVTPASTHREKRRKVRLQVVPFSIVQHISPLSSYSSTTVLESVTNQTYGKVIRAANKGKTSAGAYRAVLLQVVQRCLLCIKHARLTRQMDAQGIPYVNEVGLREPSTVLRFRLPATVPAGDSRTRDIGSDEPYGWQQMCLCLGKPGNEGWDVVVTDSYFSGLWKQQRQHDGPPSMGDVHFASPSKDDSHMHCTCEGLVLKYPRVEEDSVPKLVIDLERIWRTRTFSIGIRKLLDAREEEKKRNEQWSKGQGEVVHGGDKSEREKKKWKLMRRAFRVEAVGLTSVSFTYVGSSLFPGTVARFVVEWGINRRGCIVHSPEQLWPHTKFLEDYINGGEVELLLDAIEVTAGPLHALASAIRPARMAVPSAGSNIRPHSPSAGPSLALKSAGTTLNSYISTSSGLAPSAVQGRGMSSCLSPIPGVSSIGVPATQAGAMASNTGRSSGPGLVPSSLLPTDVSVLLRSAYWIRIVYRGEFAVDMRCFAGDQVWLQPAPPHCGGGKAFGGSLPCPQFRTFVVEHVTLGMNNCETGGGNFALGSVLSNPGNGSGPRLSNQGGGLIIRGANTLGNGPGVSHAVPAPSGTTASCGTGRVAVTSSSLASGLGLRGELNPALVGMGDDGGFGGAWVPLVALKKVLRGTLRYLGGLWLFAQFPIILKEVLVSTLRENEGALLNHDPEQPALRFFIRGCVFAVSMHRQQLFLQAINVKRYQQQQALSAAHQQAAPGLVGNLASDLSPQEMSEVGDFFARRVASEPYDASRLASFVTMLTLPVPVLREFLGLIQWKKEAIKASGLLHGPVGDGGTQAQSSRPWVELSLETPVGSAGGESSSGEPDETGGVPCRSHARSSIRHNHHQSTVEFILTFSFDASQIPHLNVAGGAGWLPQSIALRLTYFYGDGSNQIKLLDMGGSHGGHSCWGHSDDWVRCKEIVTHAVHSTTGDGHSRLISMAEAVQVALHSALGKIGTGALYLPLSG